MDTEQLILGILSQAGMDGLTGDVKAAAETFIADHGACAFCSRPATLLCDFNLGWEPAGYSLCSRASATNVGRIDQYVEGKGLPYQSIDSAVYTCDAPICDNCSTNKGHKFFCGKDGFVETVDHCPVHSAVHETDLPITANEAQKERNRIWLLCRRFS